MFSCYRKFDVIEQVKTLKTTVGNRNKMKTFESKFKGKNSKVNYRKNVSFIKKM